MDEQLLDRYDIGDNMIYISKEELEIILMNSSKLNNHIRKGVLAKPVLAKPVLAKPVVAKPVVAKPVVAKPVVAKPISNVKKKKWILKKNKPILHTYSNVIVVVINGISYYKDKNNQLYDIETGDEYTMI